MNKEEQEKLKNDLLEEKVRIGKLLDEFTTENPVIKGDRQSHFHGADTSDTSDEKAHSVTDLEQERAVEQNFELRIREINETLEKMQAGTYGVCDKCSSKIDVRRLKVMPVARFCLDCAKNTRLV